MATVTFEEQDFRTVAYACADGVTRRFRPLGLKAMLVVRRALPKIVTDLPWLNFANFESPSAAVLRALGGMAETVEQQAGAGTGDADLRAAALELCKAVKNANAAAQDSASEEAMTALLDVLAILFGAEYCDAPLTRAQLENDDPSPVSVADIPALMDIAMGMAALEKKARLGGKPGPPETKKD